MSNCLLMAFTVKSVEGDLELADFPDEIMHKVFACLDLKDLLNCGQVAKRFRNIAHDKFLWQRTELSGQNISSALIHFILDRGCKYLDLSNSRILNLDPILNIFNNCAELIELNLENVNITVKESLILVQNLTPKLKKINLGILYIRDSDKHIKILVKRCNQLQELCLQYRFPITDRAITSVIDELKNTLESLDLYTCEKISYSKLLELRLMKKLKKLNIRRSKEIGRLRAELRNLKINEDQDF